MTSDATRLNVTPTAPKRATSSGVLPCRKIEVKIRPSKRTAVGRGVACGDFLSGRRPIRVASLTPAVRLGSGIFICCSWASLGEDGQWTHHSSFLTNS